MLISVDVYAYIVNTALCRMYLLIKQKAFDILKIKIEINGILK